ncbi:hypothetical protein C1646_752605 [Rhizophagus diaphanus]|nr:hypothetical protein C1646_752605 [Rhizophagus diaphanus] [Rhizophagus sp. MUCL 43196]
MVLYAKDHIIYWFNNDKKHNTFAAINSCLENEKELEVFTIYLNFISSYAKEFVQDLDFFQQLKKPAFPFIELRLQQFIAYIETYRNSNDFDELLREWEIYCVLNNEFLSEMEMD